VNCRQGRGSPFLGHKRQAQEAVRRRASVAARLLNHLWLGGTDQLGDSAESIKRLKR